MRLRPNAAAVAMASPHGVPDPASVSFAFLPLAASLALPPALLPPPSPARTSPARTAGSPPARSARSSPLSRSPVPGAGPYGDRAAFQDMLLFDPASGDLALRRITLEWAPPPSDPGGGYSIPMGMGMGIGMGVGRAWADGAERHGELVGRESVVATWALRRGSDWAEVKSVLLPDVAARATTTTAAAATLGAQTKASAAEWAEFPLFVRACDAS